MKTVCTFSGVALVAIVPATLAFATTEPIESITIHGQKVEQAGLSLDQNNTSAGRLGLTAMQTAGSIETISKEKIALKGDFSSLSAVTRATGFSSAANPGNGGSSTSVRGFSGHGAVVNTYDGNRLYVGAGAVTFPADTWTIERIDVLRGPGSVINGVGAIGATLNYVPKAPHFGETESEIALSLGSNNLLRTAFGSGGRLNSQLAYRFDIVNHQTDGYVDRADETRDALSGSLLYKINDDIDLKFSIDYANIDAAPYWGTPLVEGKVLNSTRRKNYNAGDGKVEYKDLWPRLEINWRINSIATLRSNTFYMDAQRHWRNIEGYNFNAGTGLVDRSFFLEILHDQQQLGNRTDVLFNFQLADMDNKLSIGAEVNQINFEHTNNRPYAGTDSVALNSPNPGNFGATSSSATSLDFRSETLQYAVFLDEHLQINDQFSVVAGLRADVIDFDRQDFARSNGPGHTESASKSNNDLSGTSWRLGAVYQPSINTSLFAQVSRAVDSVQSILSASNQNLNLGEGQQFEIGIKQSLWNERLQYTLALFDITKKDLLSSEPGGVQLQVGQQSSRGIEFDLYAQVSDSLSVDFNLALTQAKFDKFASSSQDFAGNQPRNIPKRTANLWLNWQPMDAWLFSGGARYVGKRYIDNANSAKLPSYLVFDSAISWSVNRQLSLTLRGRNLTNEKDYVLSAYTNNQWVLADGRSAELTMNYKF